jgi:hypothetical protein
VSGVVADDGGQVWADALAQTVEPGQHRELLVLLDPPKDVNGFVTLGSVGKQDADVVQQAEEVARRLRVLSLYSFAKREQPRIEKCLMATNDLLEIARADTLLRHRIYTAVFKAKLTSMLDELHEATARQFLDEVSARDFTFERESYNGFWPGQVHRSTRYCPTCNTPFFTGFDTWKEDSSYRRRKDVCANCLGVSMVLENSPVAVDVPSIHAAADNKAVDVSLHIRNRSGEWYRLWIAAGERRAKLELMLGPIDLKLKPGETRDVPARIVLDPSRPGTKSFRFLILANGAAEFYSVQLAGRRFGQVPRSAEAVPTRGRG